MKNFVMFMDIKNNIGLKNFINLLNVTIEKYTKVN